MNKRLYVGNLLYEVQDQDLNDLFSQYGALTSATVVRYSDTGRSKGFGFVEFEQEADAQAALDALNNSDFKGRNIFVSEARPPQDRSERGDRNDRGPRRHGGGGGSRFGSDRGGDRGGDRRPRSDFDAGHTDFGDMQE
jgi:RNA recognition motif-containing protein